jgi:hypothetical protein
MVLMERGEERRGVECRQINVDGGGVCEVVKYGKSYKLQGDIRILTSSGPPIRIPVYRIVAPHLCNLIS